MHFEQVPLQKVKEQIARGEISLMSFSDDAQQPCEDNGEPQVQMEEGSTTNRNTSLSPELQALCEWASHEQNPKKLLELTTRINELLEQQERKTANKDPQP